jgi:hypothetical protein
LRPRSWVQVYPLAERIPSRLRTGAMLWSGNMRADQLHGLHVGLPAILPSTVLHHFKPRVIPALPMQHEAQPIGRDRDHDLLEDGP